VANDKTYILPAVIFGSVLRPVEKGGRRLVPISCQDGAIGPSVDFSYQMTSESEILRLLSESIVLPLPLYFLQLSKHVGPKVEDFVVEPF
jgi:hypothetical protein